MKKIILSIFSWCILAMYFAVTVYAIAYPTKVELDQITEPVTEEVIEEIVPVFDAEAFYREHFYQEFEYIELNTKEHCLDKINEYKIYIEYLRTNLNSLLPSEYEEVKEVVFTEIKKAELAISKYENDICIIEERLRWEAKEQEYPIATQVWLLLTEDYGFTNEVAAGIVGNIMAEIAGGTLNFSGWNITNGALGMFQWLGGRKTSIQKIYGKIPTVENQVEFMYNELYGTNGVTQQVKDWQRDEILNGKTPEEVARSFCIWFERPNGSSRPRQRYARAAYEYFMS